MAIVAGIDEAGYGPVLGPLVVSQAAFEVPDHLAGQSLWTQLAGSISAKVSRWASMSVSTPLLNWLVSRKGSFPSFFSMPYAQKEHTTPWTSTTA